MSDDNDCSHSSGFIIGLLIGAVIGALIAVYFYKHNKTKVFADLKNRLENYFKDLTPSDPKPKTSRKITVELPRKVDTLDLTPHPSAKPKKIFLKAKK